MDARGTKRDNKEVQLTNDVYSYNRKLYAKKGDKVKVIRDCGNAIIVELNVNRFTINKNQIK